MPGFPRRVLPSAAVLLSILSVPRSLPAQDSPDSARAIQALADFSAGCRKDGGALWGRSLCGPLIAVDPKSRFSVATELPPGGTFTAVKSVFIGHIPDGIPLANTSLAWVGRQWAIVLLPLPADRFTRVGLLAHESFHRIQPALGLEGADLLNPHLDERDGRYWLRLELRALAAALRSNGDPARTATRDALLFRFRRQQLYPGADTLEAALEKQEGLAEYTGDKIALAVTGASDSRVAQALGEFESRPTFVRSLGYGTGPAWGLLLDRYARGWRTRVHERGLAPQVAEALHFVSPPDLAGAADARANAYGATELAIVEDQRDRQRQAELASFHARLVDGPVLLLRQQRLQRSFNPNTLVSFGAEGTVYPTGSFSGDWGSLDVSGGGALVGLDYQTLRVPAPTDTSRNNLQGEGWTMRLAPGWTLKPGTRNGDLIVEREQAP